MGAKLLEVALMVCGFSVPSQILVNSSDAYG